MIARISSATYSCDSLLVYASFCDGSVCVFDAEDLKPRCRIAPSAFMPSISRYGASFCKDNDYGR